MNVVVEDVQNENFCVILLIFPKLIIIMSKTLRNFDKKHVGSEKAAPKICKNIDFVLAQWIYFESIYNIIKFIKL